MSAQAETVAAETAQQANATAVCPAIGRMALVAYSLPCIAASSSLTALTAILPSLYVKHASVSLAAVGMLFGLMRILDAVSDPLIGYWSDKTRSRFGPRKPWILVGAMITTLACFFLYRIPSSAGIAPRR